MELYVLMAQRKCRYEGEYAPEALACMSGPDYDDNPDYLQDAKREHTSSGEFDAVEIVVVEFDGKELERRLFPWREPLSAEVVG